MTRYTSMPVKWGKEMYDEARNRVIAHYGSCKGLVAIYEWGSVSNPGISDLDFALIFEDDAPKMPVFKRSFFALDKRTRDVLVHPLVHIPRKACADIAYANPSMSLKKIHGESVRMNKLSRKEEEKVKISLLNDLAIRHYPRDFVIGPIDVRGTLLRLNSLKYTIRSISEIFGEKNRRFEEFSREVGILRDRWFEHEDTGLLRDLHAKARGISVEIVGMMSRLIESRGLIIVDSNDDVFFDGIKNRSKFIDSWNTSIAKNSRNVALLPLVLSAQLFEYAKGNGPISDHLKKHLKGEIRYSTKMSDVMEKRIGFFNEQARLAERLRHSDFPAFFDYGFRARSGVNNKLFSLLDRVRY